MDDLTQKECAPCNSDFPPMTHEQAHDLMQHVPGWELNEEGSEISRAFSFKDFVEALAFTNKVGALAEAEGHHPDIELSWGKVRIRLSTHSIEGLSENDFIVAAKLNELHD